LNLIRKIIVLVIFLLGFAAPVQAQVTAPEQVVFGVYINDIQQLDLKTQSYAMDFYVWLRWKNPAIDPSKTFEFMNTFNRSDHTVTALYDAPQKMPDGSLYMATRFQGQFTSPMPMEKFPFDVQQLKFVFEDNASGVTKQIFVPDKVPVLMSPRVVLPGYIIDTPEFARSNILYPTTFGDLRTTDLDSYSRVTVSVPIHRHTLSNAIKVILPIFLVAACAALVFFIHPIYVEGRIGMGITALLTLVALQLTSNAQMPETDYLMMVDKLFFAAYVFVILSLAQAVRTSWPAFHGHNDVAAKQDRVAFVLLAGSFVIGVSLIMYTSLNA
jgi:hypothetical protein